MIDNFNLQVENNNKKTKIKKQNRIIMISILLFCAIVMALTAAIMFTTAKTQKIGCNNYATGTYHLDNGKYKTVPVYFFNLENDGTSQTVNISDFYAVNNGVKKAPLFFSEDPMFAERFTAVEIYNNGETQYTELCFNEDDIDDTFEIYYKGEKVKSSDNVLNAESDFIEVLIIEIIATVVLVIGALIFIGGRGCQKKGEYYRAINEKAELQLKAAGFETTKAFYLTSTKSGVTDIEKMMVLADGKNKKFAFVDYDAKKLKIVDYKDFVSYKLIEKNGTDVNSQLHYSILLDSAFSTTSSRDVCKKLQLIFVLNDEDDSTVVYEMVKSGLGMDTARYKKMSKELIDITAFLDVIQTKTPKDKKFVYCKHCGVKNSYESSHCSACSSPLD